MIMHSCVACSLDDKGPQLGKSLACEQAWSKDAVAVVRGVTREASSLQLASLMQDFLSGSYSCLTKRWALKYKTSGRSTPQMVGFGGFGLGGVAKGSRGNIALLKKIVAPRHHAMSCCSPTQLRCFGASD